MPKSASPTIHILETLLLQASIFLIPANLAFHLYIDSAYVNGRLSDYLLPKIYLTDLLILILDVIYLYRKIKYRDMSVIFNKSFWILFIYLLALSLLSSYAPSSTWYTLKLVEYYLFSRYLIQTYSFTAFQRVLLPPLFVALLGQSLLGLYQYINQRSLIGYYLMGEPNLDSLDIAKTSTFRGLEIMPYGTTAHPNILGGFIAIGLIFIVSCRQINYIKITQKAVHLMVTGLGITIIYLTKSISALSGLLLGFISRKLIFLLINRDYRLPFQIIVSISLIMSLIIYPIFYQLKIHTDKPSFYERYEINTAGIKMFIRHPLVGVGPNLFTAFLPEYPISQQQTYLLQPAHHALLLILAETGAIGLTLILINLSRWVQAAKATKSSVSAFLPLISLSVILVLDHYPMTLQTGQMLLVLSLTLPLLKQAP